MTYIHTHNYYRKYFYTFYTSIHTFIADETTVVAAILIPALENLLRADIPVSPACSADVTIYTIVHFTIPCLEITT